MNRDKSPESKVDSRKGSEKQAAGREDFTRLPAPWLLARSSMLAPRRSRRGVLLLVVLSMLVLFMLIGTAFLMYASQSRDSAKASSKLNRLDNIATKDLERAFLQLLRDTENPVSAAHTHSLLRDYYGTDGFSAIAYKFNQGPPTDPAANDLAAVGYTTRYAGADMATTGILGPTQGQFIDIYFKQLAFRSPPLTPVRSEQDPHTVENEQLITAPDARHVLKMDANVLGQPQIHSLPLTKGYYNGCLLTITSGPAAGQSTRILDYENIPWPSGFDSPNTRLFRLRVMAFGRNDGGSLVVAPLPRAPEITDLAGASFIVNGRPFNGTGVGYNALAQAGRPRLNATELLPNDTYFVGAEVGLTPNFRYLRWDRLYSPGDVAVVDPCAPQLALVDFFALNDPLVALRYPSSVGPGDADEGYDAADFQNIFLALQTVTPRSQGRVVTSNSVNGVGFAVSEFLADPSNAGDFLRLDLEDVPMPSFHRPDLINFWYHRLHKLLVAPPIGMDAATAVQAILQPYNPQTGQRHPDLTADQAHLIATIKRKIMMRPIREDHPNFDGGNPESTSFDYSQVSDFVDPVTNQNIAVPIWEIVGPWDVDNDNDGVNDSVWLDFGDPVQELEDGTRVKKLYAPLIIDMDSRLNVNAHGLADHINPAASILGLVQYLQASGALGPLVPGPNLAGAATSNQLAQGLGMGPPEISLRPLFPKPWVNSAGTQTLEGNRWEDTDGNGVRDTGDDPVDSYATLLAGRKTVDGRAVVGKYGYIDAVTNVEKASPGKNYEFQPSPPNTTLTGDWSQPDLAARLKFFDYPWTFTQRTSFGTPADLFGRYALGLDYTGQPYYEVLNDRNPNNTNLLRDLITDSPYELNLSDKQRRAEVGAQFANGAAAFDSTIDRTLAGGPSGLSDDALFAAADLERVLRAWDADTGSLPSRLWDVVGVFDPQKLISDDPARVIGESRKMFGTTAEPELLATAQQLAGINRHLVTTESSNPPIPNMTMPAYVSDYGPDGQPGRAQYDASGALLPADPSQLNALNTDDFKNIVGKDRTQSTILDLYRYRLWSETRRRLMWENGYDEVELAGLPPNQYIQFIALVNSNCAMQFGDWFADENSNSVPDGSETVVDLDLNNAYSPSLEPTLFAREVIAGKRMDLNRPFGDSRDNNNNGVVDEAIEAGEPFLDVNANGKYDAGAEPFIDMDGSKLYTAPLDELWADLRAQGQIAEPIAFDYSNGQAPLTHISLNLGGARATNLDSQARQLYARHLYCLMLLLVDENYIAPWDENDPQIKELLDPAQGLAKDIQTQLTTAGHSNAAQETRRVMLRKLTCQAIAQWAINAVDMRDADAIMTLFEYDENPWDGWGVLDSTTTDGVSTPVNIPLDGDAATDENIGMVIDWASIDVNDLAKIKPIKTISNLPTPLNRTRNIVWGAERPELLITETLATHDRRTEDTGTDFTAQTVESGNPQADDDLDQRLRPKGSLFIELYNPWSPTGQYPAELYTLIDTRNGGFVDRNSDTVFDQNDIMGVELGRMSTFGAMEVAPNSYQLTDAPTGGANRDKIRRSPVWRIAIVEEHPLYKQSPNNDTFDDQPDPLGTGVHSGAPNARYAQAAPGFFEAADPDRAFSKFFGQGWPSATDIPSDEPYIERSIYFTSDDSKRLGYNDDDDPIVGTNENFLSPNPTTIDDRLRLPPQFRNAAGVPRSARYFIAADRSQVPAPPTPLPNNFGDVEIAPIKPGRYALIATAGAQYAYYDPENPAALLKDHRRGPIDDANNQTPAIQVPRYVTTISRQDMGGGAGTMMTTDDDLVSLLYSTRRIELRPHWDPEYQQVLVASNGGTPLFPQPPVPALNPQIWQVVRRDNEVAWIPPGTPVIGNKRFMNIYDGDGDPSQAQYDPTPDAKLIPPCVAIPIKDMSVSEPLDLYQERRRQLDDEERQRADDDPTGELEAQGHYYNPVAGAGEGSFVTEANANQSTPTAYDTPFDMAPELRRNGTTRNYRTIHLQRLADPTLPWNPLPTLPDGTVNPQHDPKLPVNLYRTIDTSSVDLTAYNGTSARETAEGDTKVEQEGRWLPPNTIEFRNMFSDLGSLHRIHFRSSERGTHAKDVIAKNGATDISVDIAARALWRQEPINAFTELQTWLWVDPNQLDPKQARMDELAKRANENRLRDRETLDADIDALVTVLPSDEFNQYPASLKAERQAHFDFVLDHSLGFSNESFGAVYSRADLQGKGLPVTADGAPSRDGFESSDTKKFPFTRHNPELDKPVVSSYPWLAWGNRPFVSAGELLNVPGTSSSQMLRQYSTAFRTAFNPYDGTGIDAGSGNVLSVGQRLAAYLSPYGHLFSAFQTATLPAGIARQANGTPLLDAAGNWQFIGAPHYYRILDYVHSPSRFVGTETMLTAEIFNDVLQAVDTVGTEITSPQDPRLNFRPPFNKVSRERDPGKVNLNTVTGRREVESGTGIPRIWSEVFDGVMHRDRDMNQIDRVSHLGPAWRDVVLSRRGYAQRDAASNPVDRLSNATNGLPDTLTFGLNNNFPSFFSNPFRSPDAGDLVPLQHMMHYGIDASWQRRHHYNRGGRNSWGRDVDDDDDPTNLRFETFNDTREAGFGGDDPIVDAGTGALLPIASTSPFPTAQSGIPLFSESFTGTTIDGERNPYFYYQPMTRMENLVTNRSNVFAIWITVGYFEVEPAPNWNDPDLDRKEAIRARFGGTLNDSAPETVAGLALYNRVYPDGYMLGREVGSETGNVKRPRGFFMVDRTEEVGFKPGEDLNVEKMIKLRRRIE